MKATLIANGSIPPSELFFEYAKSSDLIIAVDGGAHHCKQANIQPHILIGDFDSISPELLAELQKKVLVLSFPEDKDASDLQLALLEAESRGAKEIFIFSAFDEKIDYGLAALIDAAAIKSKISFFTSRSQIFLLNEFQNNVSLSGLGRRLSIFPLLGPIKLVSKGLQWELSWDHCDKLPISLSNRIAKESAEVSLISGTAFVLIDWDSEIPLS